MTKGPWSEPERPRLSVPDETADAIMLWVAVVCWVVFIGGLLAGFVVGAQP
jgi:hypothetical protein